ncbi:MAG: matrixin family metalloprotease [Candidatus Melainabacteria bacterium]|nr:matrixin family metalloprotease [Candidatus Melainabacteria bacterium]
MKSEVRSYSLFQLAGVGKRHLALILVLALGGTFLLPSTFSLAGSGALGQVPTRKLQRATFQSFSSGGEPLAPASGLHLTPGLDRTPGTGSQMYNPGEPSLNMGLCRWESRKMPLKIWISPGLQLPEMGFTELQKVRPDQVFEMLQQPGDPFAGLSQAREWTEDTNYQVAAGIEQWREFEREGLFSFGFTTDPRQAQIMVFFVDSFKDSTSPGGIMVGGNTCAQLYTYEQAQSINIAQKPVIIEMSTLVNREPQKMIAASAHEFGHALGIKAHSPYRDDIMHENRVVNSLSPADKATIRRLYRSKPAYVM